MPAGDVLKATVLTIGSTSTVFPITVLASAGSDSWQLVSGTMSDLRVGMVIVPALEVAPPGGVPNGLAIVGINEPVSGSIELGGGGYGYATGAPWIYTQPASLTLEADLNAVDEYPYGTLAATVTPTTGVTITGYNLDGGSDSQHTDDGSAMSNSGGQAMATFSVEFADAGTFTLQVAYTSYDTDYADTSSSTTVVVS